MHINKFLFFVLFFLNYTCAFAQYNVVAKTLLNKRHIKAQVLKGNFTTVTKDNVYYTTFSNPIFPIKYTYNGDCGIFEIFSSRIKLDTIFEDLQCCDLDNLSFKAYKFTFLSQQYFALECIVNGSGSITNAVMIHLFQVDKNHINYYPLWSRYGSMSCLGDFDKNGQLDFLRIRNNEKYTGHNTFKANLTTMDIVKKQFINSYKNKEWIFERLYRRNSLVINVLKDK